MNEDLIELIWYSVPIVIIFGFYLIRNHIRHETSVKEFTQAVSAGLTEPASLHPKIDASKCVGSGACVSVCPEGNVIGMINGKAHLINPTKCIGHGVCKTACPLDAIALVFGTEKRGVEIPDINPDFQTNVNGIYIAGELGGMGLIRNAVEQGKQAINEIAKSITEYDPSLFDVIIIGAGPAGIAASLTAKERNLNYKTIEQDSLGGTVAHFPKGKIVMTAPAILPLVGEMPFTETTKEVLVNYFETIEKENDLIIDYQTRMEDILEEENGFVVKTNTQDYKTKKILLTIGRRGTPRKLGVKGEDKPKVVYRLIDPVQYRDQHVLVVGGGDSALEAALSIADENNTVVSLSYRSESFGRAKQKNRENIEKAQKEKRINVYFSSLINEIKDEFVEITQQDKHFKIKNDAIIVCAGGLPPTPMLKKMGITVETKHGEE